VDLLQIEIAPELRERWLELANATAERYRRVYNRHEDLRDGQGNCAVVMVATLLTADAYGLIEDAAAMGGLNNGDHEHYWVEFADGTVFDSPDPLVLRVWKPPASWLRPVPEFMRKARKAKAAALNPGVCLELFSE
jgi:hypothetical protein